MQVDTACRNPGGLLMFATARRRVSTEVEVSQPLAARQNRSHSGELGFWLQPCGPRVDGEALGNRRFTPPSATARVPRPDSRLNALRPALYPPLRPTEAAVA